MIVLNTLYSWQGLLCHVTASKDSKTVITATHQAQVFPATDSKLMTFFF